MSFKVGDKVRFNGKRCRIKQAYWSTPKMLDGRSSTLPSYWIYHIAYLSQPGCGCFATGKELEPLSALHALAEVAE